MTYEIHNMDCRVAMSLLLAPDSVDSICCDPPYGLSREPDAAEVLRHWLNGDDYAHTGNGFMGKSWDSFVPGPSVWREAYRVLKPGGYLLAFFGTRTYDLGVMAIRLAGFEIRDEIAWLYGSGFPKSLDVGKAIDRAASAEREIIGPSARHGGGIVGNGTSYEISPVVPMLTAPSTDAAKQWDGWGTALKPAHEPIVVARKPFPGTVAQNVQTYGTGALNIDACRVGSESTIRACNAGTGDRKNWRTGNEAGLHGSEAGRFPANVIHDGHVPFPATTSIGHTPSARGAGGLSTNGHAGQNAVTERTHDSGSAARFFKCCQLDDEDIESSRIFYAAKASKRDRSEGCDTPSTHPTVKPTELMRYLVRLVTPPGGTVLDPFTGSGSTGKAAILEGFDFIGCELDADYVRIAEARCAYAAASLSS